MVNRSKATSIMIGMRISGRLNLSLSELCVGRYLYLLLLLLLLPVITRYYYYPLLLLLLPGSPRLSQRITSFSVSLCSIDVFNVNNS
jgi:hypothetical protein